MWSSSIPKKLEVDPNLITNVTDKGNGKNTPTNLKLAGESKSWESTQELGMLYESMMRGEIGELHQVIITSRDPGMAPDTYIEVSGGIFRDMTIHDFDLARYMLNDEIETVSATGSRLVDPALMNRCNDFDTVVVTMTTRSGKQAVITNSRQAVYGYDQRVELFGNKGMLISENRRHTQVTKHLKDATSISEPLLNFFIERYAEAFNAEINSFVQAINGKAPVEVGFEDGRIALLLAEAAFKSAHENRVIQLNEIN